MFKYCADQIFRRCVPESEIQNSLSFCKFKDKKGTENVVADHLSRLHFDTIMETLPLNESFPDEQLMSVEVLPWYVDIVNYLVTG